MWFLIRCAFWLSIVFALLPWPDNSGFGSSPPAAIWSRTRDAIGAAIVKARAAGEKICTDSPLECLKAAAQLDQYAADQRVEGGPAAGAPQSRLQRPVATPRRSRRHSRRVLRPGTPPPVSSRRRRPRRRSAETVRRKDFLWLRGRAPHIKGSLS